MLIKNQILTDAIIGSNIGILLETNQISGKVIYLSPAKIGIKSQAEGTVFIKYEDILSYRILIDENTVKQVDSAENLSQNANYKETSLFNITGHKTISETETGSAGQELSFKVPDKNTAVLLEIITESFSYFNFINIPVITDYKKYARKNNNRGTGQINKIITEIEKRISLGYRSVIENKNISSLILKLLKEQSVEHENKNIYNFLGSLYFKCDYYKLALDYFELGSDNVSGFILAESCRRYDRQVKFAIRHLFDKEKKEAYIINFLIHSFIEQDDYTLIHYLGQNIRKKQLTFLPEYHIILSVILRYHGIVNINDKLLSKATLENTRQLYAMFCSRPLGSKRVFLPFLCNALFLNKNSFKSTTLPVNALTIKKTAVSSTENPTRNENKNTLLSEQETSDAVTVDKTPSSIPEFVGEADKSNVTDQSAKTSTTQLFDGIPDYNALGNSAILDKNYSQAVDYFKLALDNNQKITSSVPQLVSILTKLEMYNDAYDILKKYQHTLNTSVYYNLQISIFKKAKNPSQERDCVNAFENLIKAARKEDNQTKLFLLIIDLSQYLLIINNCAESFKRLYEAKSEFLNFIDSTDSSLNNNLISSFYIVLISDCEKLQKYSEASEYANELLQLCPKTNLNIATKYQKVHVSQESPKKDYLALAVKKQKTNDIDNAIEYYNLAIQNRQKLSTSIPNMVNLLSRVGRDEEALNILDSHRRDLDSGVLHNMKVSLYKKLKEKGNKSDCLKSYDYLLSHANEPYKELSIKVDSGIYLYLIGDNAKSIEILTECLNSLNSTIISDSDRKKIETPLYPALIKNYLILNDVTSAKKIASELLTKNPASRIAHSVISDNITDIFNRVPGQEVLTYTDILRKISIFSYINNQIDSAHLNVLSRTLIKEDKFTGDLSQAKELILNISQLTQHNKPDLKKRKSILFAIARLYKQLLEKNTDIFEDEVINEDKYNSAIVKGAIALADFKLMPNKKSSLTSARYLYLQPVFLYSHDERSSDKKIPDNDCLTSVYRYIATFFINIDDYDDFKLTRKISFPMNSTSAIDIKFLKEDFSEFLCSLLEKKILNTDINSFIVDMFFLLHEIPLLEDAFLSSVFFKYIRNDIANVLSLIQGKSAPASFTVEEFRTMWRNALNIYFQKLNIFIQQIDTAINQIFSLSDFTSNLKNLKLFDINVFLNRTDRQYILTLYNILDKIYQFNEISEFDYKTDMLREAETLSVSLNNSIEYSPTLFSYEFLREDLNHLISLIGDEADHLYSNSTPNLTIGLLGDCSVNYNERIISIPVVLKNEDNVQTAIVTSFNVQANDCEEYNDKASRIFHIGSKDVQKLIKLKVPEYVLNEDMLDITVSLTYQYKINRNESAEESQKFRLSVQINKTVSFETIDNKFNILKDGGVVDNQKMFYGRDQFINSLIDRIEPMLGVRQGHCTALYGQTRTGKSSILLHLRRRLRLSRFGSSCIIVNLDSMGMQDLHDSYIVGFLYSIIDALSTELNENHPDLIEILKENNLVIDPDELMNNEDNAQIVFNSIFKKFTSIITNLAKPYIIIITIDEFTYIYDWIRQGKMSDRIMKFWKAFIQNNPIFAIIIGQDHMMKFVEDERFSNDFGATELKKVNYLSKADAFKLMDEPIMLNRDGILESRYKKGALERLYELTSGSAYLIAMFCAGMVDYLNEIRSVYITKAHIDEYLKLNLHNFEEAKFFDPQYHDKSDILNEVKIIKMNKEILKRIAQMSSNKDWADISKIVKNEEERKILYNLENRDVVIIEHGRRCKIKVALYKEWLIERYGRS